jgi:DMSO/TMAO reductase YedYZ molybdopterin-dependent catalytic subunit
MDAVGTTDRAAFIIFEAHAGYTTSIPIREALKDNVILAHTFSGERLAEPHGAPLRGLDHDDLYKSLKEVTRRYPVPSTGYRDKTGWRR